MSLLRQIFCESQANSTRAAGDQIHSAFSKGYLSSRRFAPTGWRKAPFPSMSAPIIGNRRSLLRRCDLIEELLHAKIAILVFTSRKNDVQARARHEWKLLRDNV